MQQMKAALRLGPKTYDEDYDKRRAAMKSLHSAISSYNGAIESLLLSMKKVTEALGRTREAFEKLADDSDMPAEVTNTVAATTEAFNRIVSDFYPQFKASIENACYPPINNLKIVYKQCAKLEDERNSAMNSYDVVRGDVNKKEKEYAKKGKDVNESRSYLADVEKRNELQARFVAADERFKAAHDTLRKHRSEAASTAIHSFLEASYDLCYAVAAEIHTVRELAQDGEEKADYEY